MRHAVDLIIEARWIIPVEPARTVLEQHALVVDGDCIVGVVPAAEAGERFAARHRVQLDEHVLLPGFVNLHTHAAMSLLRGLADDLPLMTWLSEHIWPAEAKHVAPAMVRDGTRLAAAEMLRAGVTCFNDMYFFPEATVEAALEAGMRVVAGITVLDFPTAYAADADAYLEKGLAARDRFAGDARVRFAMAPHAPYTVSDRSFEKALTLARQLDLPIHVHIHETADEIAGSLREHGVRPLARLERLGLLGPELIGVHAVHLEPGEVARLAHFGAHVAHCPSSNLKLASGIPPLTELLRAGVNVGLGTDGAASNNRLDPWTEMRTAALLAKGASGDPCVADAHTALAMATLNGARALGLDGEIGSLVAGKAADVVAVRLDALELLPCFDVPSHLVYAAGREHVSHVWVDGRLCLDNGRLTTLDAAELRSLARSWQNRLRP